MTDMKDNEWKEIKELPYSDEDYSELFELTDFTNTAIGRLRYANSWYDGGGGCFCTEAFIDTDYEELTWEPTHFRITQHH